MASEACCIGRGVAAVRHKSRSWSFTYCAMLSLGKRFAKFEGERTVFGSINRQDFHGLDFVVPSSVIVNRYEAMVKPMDDLLETNFAQNASLIALRHVILPKLMSGELRAGDF